MPGPTSTTFFASAAPLISAMRRGTLASVRKFCPSDLEKWKPCRPSTARMVWISQRFICILLILFYCSGSIFITTMRLITGPAHLRIRRLYSRLETLPPVPSSS